MSTSNQLIHDEWKAQAIARRLQEQNECVTLPMPHLMPKADSAAKSLKSSSPRTKWPASPPPSASTCAASPR